MNGSNTKRRVTMALAVAAVAALALAACSSDKKSESATTTQAPAASAQTVAFDKTIQQQLADVGCYSGSVDGILGPETDAAILAFQNAAGLTPDGQLGPETESALSKDAKDKKKVCGTTDTTKASTSTTISGSAPCTATALTAALPSGTKISSYVCSDGYAGVTATPASAILQSEGTKWKSLGEDPCGSASAGIAPEVLAVGCPAN